VSNIRGTDDQDARAKWCHDFGFALRADQADLADISAKVRELQNPQVREQLTSKCAELPDTTGGAEIAKILYELATAKEPVRPSRATFIRLNIQEHLNRGLRHVAYLGLRRLALVYRKLRPHNIVQATREEPPIWGDQSTAKELQPLIKGNRRFEHLISGASDGYKTRREEIARVAYGERTEAFGKK
jgi:hypothetical protein